MPTVSILNKGITYEFTNESSLLESIEKQGVQANYSCRSGHCGACLTKLIQGQVSYEFKPIFTPPENHILSCCSKPETLILIEVD